MDGQPRSTPAGRRPRRSVHRTIDRLLLPIVGALVVEEGGPFCHAAIVAREFGCSAVTGAHEATARIPHGADVEVGAVRCTVTIH